MKRVVLFKSGENVYLRGENNKILAWFQDTTNNIEAGKYEYYLDTEDPGRVDLVLIKKQVKRKEA
jgi:hypothetical protein